MVQNAKQSPKGEKVSEAVAKDIEHSLSRKAKREFYNEEKSCPDNLSVFVLPGTIFLCCAAYYGLTVDSESRNLDESRFSYLTDNNLSLTREQGQDLRQYLEKNGRLANSLWQSMSRKDKASFCDIYREDYETCRVKEPKVLLPEFPL
jgi:hypothetical protein